MHKMKSPWGHEPVLSTLELEKLACLVNSEYDGTPFMWNLYCRLTGCKEKYLEDSPLPEVDFSIND
jgi:hypothetical protein